MAIVFAKDGTSAAKCWGLVSRSDWAFIDARVAGVEFLLGNLRPDTASAALTADEPALVQIARTLAGQRDVGAVHIFAHGRTGEVDFAGGAITANTLDRYREALVTIGRSLSSDGEIVLWVCEAARGRQGAEFIERLADLSGARVSASTGLVGASSLGGSWNVDASSHSDIQPPLTAPGMAGYAGVFVTFTATVGTDNPALSTGADTVIVSATGQIQVADTFQGDLGTDTIQIGTAAAGTSIDLSAACTAPGYLDTR